ncbi:MAG TPA: agmatine deiminase family protein [Rhodothermales bacterium]
MSNPEEERQTPAALGFRMPAEWERHRATWFSWPHNLATWPDELEAVERTLAGAVRAIATGEEVFVNVLDEKHRRHVEAVLAAEDALQGVRFFEIPTDDAWVRDHGPIFVRRVRDDRLELAATTWGFNSWGEKYPPWDLDDAASERMAEALGVPVFEHEVILEGGSIDVNGAGALLTTESCLLNPNRNPDLGRVDIERLLRSRFGVDQVIWLGDGISGDDTDGHVDDITRFVAEDAVVTVVCTDVNDPDYEPLQRNLEILQETRLTDGRLLHVHTLPAPRPVFVRGERMPASYANFYVANAVVVVPTYEDEADVAAIATLQRLFPDRQVVGMDCRELIWGLGAIHCLTQQVPVGEAADGLL